MGLFRKCITMILGTSVLAAAAGGGCADGAYASHHSLQGEKFFQRIATFPVFLNTDEDSETVAEIVAAAENGRTLIYTDSEFGGVGFVDISKPNKPAPAGFIALDGEPTSVAVRGAFALVASNTSQDFVNTSGLLDVVDLRTRSVVKTFDLGGQPDSVAVSPDGRFAAIVIENERDEELGDGAPPQQPGGFLAVLRMPEANPEAWTLSSVDLTNIAEKFPEDPEPEFVDINRINVAAVSLQENNHLIYVDLPTGKVIQDFSAGSVDLDAIDAVEESPALISLSDSLTAVPREPDALAWVNPWITATADEGDLDGGSRGFTLFGPFGNVLFSSGNQLEHAAVRFGHYPDARSGNKGNEPEGIEFGRYGSERLLFVGSERANLVHVYNMQRFGRPKFKQVLPTGVGPEGLLAIPGRNLFIVASEVDNRDAKIRSSISIYKLKNRATYPTIRSANRADGSPIPWSALSGLAVDPGNPRVLYSIYDSFYQQSRIFVIDASRKPALIFDEIVLQDQGALAAVDDKLVNADGTVNLDPEGIAVAAGGGFWVASEGAGSVDDDERPIATSNLIVRTDAHGFIEQVVTLPERLNARQLRFGLEGVASTIEDGLEVLYVAFQRAWQAAGDPADKARIGRYDTGSGEWTFAYYPLTTPTSPNGGWVGLSEISALGGGRFAVIERDNQSGPDARIKRIAQFSIRDVSFSGDDVTPDFDTVTPTLARDLIGDGDLTRPGGLIYEKIEGMAVRPNGTAFVVNDNDGVDDNSGETQLIRLRKLLK